MPSNPNRIHLNSGSLQSAGTRLRILICDGAVQEVSRALHDLNTAETTYIPTSDLREVSTELIAFHPDYVVSSSSLFQHLLDATVAPQRGRPAQTRAPSNSAMRAPCSPRLNRRELEVTELLAKGWRNIDIAQTVGTTESTVKRILQSLYSRFGAANRAEFLGQVIELHLLDKSSEEENNKVPPSQSPLLERLPPKSA